MIEGKKEKLKEKKGITLIALVITIIVLLILAGVSIRVLMGDNGITNKAKIAKEQTEIKEILEELNLRKEELRIENYDKGKNELKVEEYDKYIIEKDIEAGEIEEKSIVESSDKQNAQVEVNGYVFSVTQITETQIVIEYWDKAINLPYIAGIETEETTNSIEVKSIEVYRADEGNYKISYKKVGEENYKQEEKIKIENFDNYVMKELNKGTYEIKIEVSNKSNKTVIYKFYRQTKDFELAEGMINAEKVEWNNTTGYAKVSLKTNEEFIIEYQVSEEINVEGEWKRGGKTAEVENVESGSIIWARLSDGTNATSNYYEMFEVKDITEPTLKIEDVSIRSNSITVKAVAEDKETGIAGDAEYHFYFKNYNEEEYQDRQNTASNVLAVSELIQKQKYKVKVQVADRAGNMTEMEKEIETSELKSDGNITFGTVTWDTTKKANVTMSTTTGYTIQYQIGGVNGAWITGTNATGISNRQTVYARLIDGINEASDYASAVIVDQVAPEAFTISVNNLTNNGFSINLSQQIDNQTGIANIKYYVNTSTSGTSYQTSNEVNGLSNDTTRYVWAVATDIEGNTRRSTNYIKVVTGHTHTSSCYTTTSKLYVERYMTGQGMSTYKDYSSYLYCPDCNKVVKSTSGTKNWSYVHVWGSTTSTASEWSCSWDNTDGHKGNWYLNEDWTNSEVKNYEHCCINDYANDYDSRSSSDTNRLRCKHFTNTLKCTKSSSSSSTSYNF